MSIPQRIAAIPSYIPSGTKTAFADSAPGHKFLGYFRNWQGENGDAFLAYKGKARIQGDLPAGQQKRAANDQLKNEYDAVLNEVCELGPSAKAQIAALRTRQKSLIAHCRDDALSVSTKSTAPFATGLGNEHPIENGFAFLTPYGLPYLAGSGVKGIMRRAMQELRDDGKDGFTDAAIDALFGPENFNEPEDAKRGALDFWDVFPSPAGGKLVVEIMTPHYSGYYQGKDTPHDSGSPVPVSFLAVPAKSDFDFHVVCHATRLSPELQAHWRALLTRALAHAFEWVGFGAKTSVGYGAFAPLPAAVTARGTSATGVAGVATSVGADIQTWATAKLSFTPNTGEIKAAFAGKVTVGLKGAEADALRAALGEERAARLKKKQELKDVAIEVESQGNQLRIKGLAPT